MKVEPLTIVKNGSEVHGEILGRKMTSLTVSITSPYRNLSAGSVLPGNGLASPNWNNTLATELGLDVAKDLLSILYQLASLLDQNWDFLVEELAAEGSRQTGLTPAELKEEWAKRKRLELQDAEARAKKDSDSPPESGRSKPRVSPWISMSPSDEKIVTVFCERNLPVHLSESLKFKVFNILLAEKDYIHCPES